MTKKPLRTGRVFLKAVALTNNSSVGPQQKYKMSITVKVHEEGITVNVCMRKAHSLGNLDPVGNFL